MIIDKDTALVANKALQVKNVGANNFTLGDGTIKLIVNYRVITL